MNVTGTLLETSMLHNGAQIHSHTFPNKPRQFPFIPPQNEHDAFANLQTYWKGSRNSPPSYDRMQPFLKWTSKIISNTLPPHPPVLQYHINTVGVTGCLKNIFHTLQEQLKGIQTTLQLRIKVLNKLFTRTSKGMWYIGFNLYSVSVNIPWYSYWWSTSCNQIYTNSHWFSTSCNQLYINSYLWNASCYQLCIKSHWWSTGCNQLYINRYWWSTFCNELYTKRYL